jgi:hypothetical protein
LKKQSNTIKAEHIGNLPAGLHTEGMQAGLAEYLP